MIHQILFLLLLAILRAEDVQVLDEEYLPMPMDIPLDRQILPSLDFISPYSAHLLNMMTDLKMYRMLKDRYVHVGMNDYLILKNIGLGAEGSAYLAEASNHQQVVIKKMLNFKKAKKSYDNEIYGLKKLARLYDEDPEHLIIVQEKINGLFFDEIYDEYVKSHGGFIDYPSKIVPASFKDKFFKILYDFRNLTNMAHNDFRPYNIVNNTVIDFGRSIELSSDPSTRQTQIEKDDRVAQEEWEYFVNRRDIKALEQNPFLPNAIEVAEKAWKYYAARYESDNATTRYISDWMEVLNYILKNNDTTVDFPAKEDY